MSESQPGGLLVRHVLGHYANPAANHSAVRNDVAQHAAHHVYRNGEPDTFDAEILGNDGRVDPDECAARVDQRASGVPEIDGRVRLDEVLERCDAELLPAGGTDNAVGDGLRQADGVADREHDIADP